MSLIKCPECGKEISDKSKVCIHCGFPLHEEPVKEKPIEILKRSSSSIGGYIVGFFLINLISGLLTFALSIAFYKDNPAIFVGIATIADVIMFILALSFMISGIIRASKSNNRINIPAIEYNPENKEFICHSTDDLVVNIPYQDVFSLTGYDQIKVICKDKTEVPLGHCESSDVLEAGKRIKEIIEFINQGKEE